MLATRAARCGHQRNAESIAYWPVATISDCLTGVNANVPDSRRPLSTPRRIH